MTQSNLLQNRIRHVALLLTLCVLLPLFTGCGKSAPQGKRTLWVLTEQSTWDRMGGQLYVLKKAYEEAHADVDIQVDYLPTDPQEREVYLQQIRTQILQGGGPDCYLLPTDNTLILDEPTQYTYVTVDPLFSDVELAMRNGLFYDISSFYEADDSLGKECLNSTIMDSGVVSGSRYVLPLRYDIPTIYGDVQTLEAAGMDASLLTQDIGTIMEAVYATGDPLLAGGILREDLNVFSDFIDYHSGNAIIREGALIRYMESYRQLKSLLGTQYLDNSDASKEAELLLLATEDTILLEPVNDTKYIYCHYGSQLGNPIPSGKQYISEYYPLWIGSMQDVFEYVPTAMCGGSQVTITPMRTTEGDVVATVTYYGAVGSGCTDPELAYDFLRQFLLEDSQWETNRPTKNHTKPLKGPAGNSSNDQQYPGLLESGWPVRDKDSLKNLWNIRRRQLFVLEMNFRATNEQQRRMRKIGRTGELDESANQLLDMNIDQVRYNTTMSDAFSAALAQLNDPGNGNTPTNADIEKLAQQLVWNIRWHVSEG